MKPTETPPIGIQAAACYVPKGRLTVEEIASRAGVPLEGVAQRFDMKAKPIASEEESASEMGLRAARAALEKADVDPKDVQLLIVGGTGLWDYPYWPIAAKLQHELGLEDASSFELISGCLGGVLGLRTAESFLCADVSATTAVVVTTERLSPFVDHRDLRHMPMWHLSDGATAAVVRKGETRNRLLAYKSRTIGRLHHYTRGSWVGEDASGGVLGHMKGILGLHKELAELFVPNYRQVIGNALEAAGRRFSDVRWLFTIQENKSLFTALLDELELAEDRVYTSIEQFGHMGSCDPLLGLVKAEEEGRLERGDIAILGASSPGFTWGALVIEH
jgi:3-oxoacyl-[acyl-carrier-protein] synthase-3